MLHKRHIGQPQLSKRAFWDTDMHMLDFDKHFRFVIARVFERGSEDDQEAIVNFYGKERIIDTLTNMSSLMPIAKERAKQAFQLADIDFACYTSKQRARNFSKY